MSSICLTIFNQFLASKTFKLYPRGNAMRRYERFSRLYCHQKLLETFAKKFILEDFMTTLWNNLLEAVGRSPDSRAGLVEAKKRISARFSCQRFDEIFQRRLKERKNSQQQNGGGGGNNDDYREGSAMEQIVDALIEMGCTGEEKDDDDGVPP